MSSYLARPKVVGPYSGESLATSNSTPCHGRDMGADFPLQGLGSGQISALAEGVDPTRQD